MKKEKERRKKSKRKYFGSCMTLLLVAVIVAMVSLLWSLFISGPVRIHEEKQADRYKKIREEVPGIKGLEENTFDYITYQGYTEDTLYWFDEKCQIITKRKIGTLDYEQAKRIAKNEYNIKCDSIALTFGYDSPCYEIHGSDSVLMLDYDTLERVYERKTE